MLKNLLEINLQRISSLVLLRRSGQWSNKGRAETNKLLQPETPLSLSLSLSLSLCRKRKKQSKICDEGESIDVSPFTFSNRPHLSTWDQTLTYFQF
jgi:hypothetical protein